MKKHFGLILLLAAFTCPVFADSAYAGPSGLSAEVQVRTSLFDITCQGGGSAAEALLKELELRFEVYNRLFRFNTSQLKGPLRVRAFTDKGAYDRYVTEKLGAAREGAVYLHYNQAEKRELIVNLGSPELDRVFPHQSFIQFLRSNISYPPSWIREGFAIYFSNLKYNRELGNVEYEENLAWLETVKSLLRERREPSFQSVLLADVSGPPENFHPAAWALVSFFLNAGGNGDYFRSLTESFLLMKSEGNAAENDQIVLDRLISWTSLQKMHDDYAAYVMGRKTFNEIVDAGQQNYAAGNYDQAEVCFLEALRAKPHYAPYYYLGLIAYTQKKYDIADQYYRSAELLGADKALVQYALGVNAASAGRNNEAVQYLNNASYLSPERYRDRVAEILKKLAPPAADAPVAAPSPALPSPPAPLGLPPSSTPFAPAPGW
ncbi:MAG: hypothetical protein LBS82_00920 [Spirochaetaceae bacterium]|jgi:tetratricopeptide (TPR) repeat protein|nr:hypothetical protein [Spirochaetaceae bacterium]